MNFLIMTLCLMWLNINAVFSICPADDEFDYIIVGGGVGGSVVAGRLTENPSVTVLILEAGDEPSENSSIPLLAFDSVQTRMDWNFTSTPQKQCCGVFNGGVMPLAQGKTLGGSGSLNSMTYTRCNKKDYDLWAQKGNTGWGYDDIFKYFLKMEDYQIPHPPEDDQYHSTGGPISVSLPRFQTPLMNAFLDAGRQLNKSIIDFNAATQTGFMYPPTNSKNGSRCSSYVCYVKANQDRANLIVRTDSFVTKIILDGNQRATGVQYLSNSDNCTAKARKEIIISGGAFNSPKVLMLSGIGNKNKLQALGIPVVVDLPGVGENLQDHIILQGQLYKLNQKVSLNSARYRTKQYLDEWYANRTGPFTVPVAVEGVAFRQSPLVQNETDFPDNEVYFISDNPLNVFKSYKPYINVLFPLVAPGPNEDAIAFLLYILHPKSRGCVTLKSSNPLDDPLINPNYMAHPDDVDSMVESLKFSYDIANTNAFKQYGAQLLLGGVIPNCVLAILGKDAYYKCIVKYLSSPGLHYCGTCKMGPPTDSMAVVDSRLRVYNVTGLRVVDASIMPDVPTGHTNVPTMMVAEKAADMIKEDNP